MAKKTTVSAPALDLESEDVKVEIEASAGDAENRGPAGEQPELPELPATAAKTEPAPAQRQGDETRPFCGKHNCLMKATSSSPDVTRYSCPVPLCDQKEKRVRGAIKIPREPSLCPDIRCRGQQSYLEVDLRRSTTAHLSMVCPNCAYEIKVPRPAYNAGQRVYEREELDISAR